MPASQPIYTMVTIHGRTVRMARWPARGRNPAARPLLFFNGIGANIELIAPMAARMPNREILTFDMPGVGGSPEPMVPYNAWMMGRISEQLLDRFDIRRWMSWVSAGAGRWRSSSRYKTARALTD